MSSPQRRVRHLSRAALGTTVLAIAGSCLVAPAASADTAPQPTGQPTIESAAAIGATTSIQILGINDFHGRIEQNLGNGEAGAAVLGGALAELKETNPNTLLVSAGDNIGASTFTSFSQQDNPTIDALAAGGLDVSAVGNHEFDRGFADLADRVVPRYAAAAGTPATGEAPGDFALGANVYQKGTDTPALQEYALREVDGVTVGFIGTVTEQTASMVTPSGITDIEFGDQTAAANRVAGQLSDGEEGNGEADVVVLLAHDGSASSDCAAIATEATAYGDLVRGASPEIDAILSGHTHQAYDCSFPVEGWEGMERPVLQAHQYGTTVDQLTIEVDTQSNKVVAIEGGLLSLTETTGEGDAAVTLPAFPALPAVTEIVEKATAQAEIEGAVKVGSITADILRGGTAGSDRGVESTLGNLVADIQLWATSTDSFAGEKADIAIMNPGGLRADLLYGEDGTVTYKDVADVQPFGNTLVTLDLTGAQLKQILEEQWQPEGSSRPKLHLGISEGLSYVYEPDAARGEHIVSASFNGVEIADDQVFRVTTNSFLASGGDNFTTFAAGANVTDTGQSDLVATVQYFEAHPVVEPAPLGRAVVATDDGNGNGNGNAYGHEKGKGHAYGHGKGNGPRP